MKTLISIVTVLLSLVTASRAPAATAPKPNIIFIMADDLGWADVAFHGGNAPTPHLDRLAKESLELTQHYVAPVCSPTRSGLMSGRCWSRFNVTNPQNERAFAWDMVTLPRALKGAGYATCLTGKWHLGSLPEQGPNHFGFDHSYGSLAGGVSPWNHRYKKGPFTETWHRNEKLLEETGHVTDLIAKEAIEWMAKRGSEPFFLYVPFTAVHLPVKEPEEWVRKVPAAITGDVNRHYAASIMHLDDSVGKILAALEKSGKRDNTLVIFTSDNGGSTAENNDLQYPDDNCPNGKLPANNAPWRGQKAQMYEGGVRVPAIVRWPAKIKAGKADTAVQIIDWMPTFCALAGYTPPQDLKWDGVSLVSLLTEGKVLAPRALYSVAPGWRARSLRYENWKLIVTGKGEAAKNELFDLKSDPAEANNLAALHPDKVKEMQAKMDAMAARDRDAEVKQTRTKE